MTENDKLTEEKIFESATEIFIEKGMDGARMKDIADHAGINKALLHYYYRTKDHLFNAVFEKMAGLMFKKFAPVFDERLSFEDKIKFFFREHITFLQQNPRLPAFILYELSRHPERIKKLIQNLDVEKLWETLEKQHEKDLKKYNITKENIPQFMTSVAAMSVFPFLAKPIISGVMEKIGYNFDEYLEQRKSYAPEFILKAISKTNRDELTLT
ncbi:MAG TPA: TetR/AcrR family transcriptional regulator [Bacteroidales bacterium]|jgi:AcrR family transcriptional regulator|nr:TetR family transcriptional regulator [Bacteroidales bacterium]OQB63252.1 MAG: HTH-type transcriptional repressor Bm3R1 [Bacteroidetes bacterium ADurb.Bin145]HOU01215.1 TetR/AcrR family transcriptional regulator [Bacteroidales bacterium]HQG62059.1 TetR/AcrR family transcriptional regulator [Bacteroidales bacterium]HQK67182.1 TetR/AcrR family transcriptional regulator [Bacteroidales bacterium]